MWPCKVTGGGELKKACKLPATLSIKFESVISPTFRQNLGSIKRF